jgi:hypothetical protein
MMVNGLTWFVRRFKPAKSPVSGRFNNAITAFSSRDPGIKVRIGQGTWPPEET